MDWVVIFLNNQHKNILSKVVEEKKSENVLQMNENYTTNIPLSIRYAYITLPPSSLSQYMLETHWQRLQLGVFLGTSLGVITAGSLAG